jgi:hypothetical protein
MTSSGWQERLDQAGSTQDLIGVVNEFLSLWTAEETQRIPEDCRIAYVTSVQQVSAQAYLLAHRKSGKNDAAMHRLSTFFTNAALRLFRIAEGEADGAEPRGNRVQVFLWLRRDSSDRTPLGPRGTRFAILRNHALPVDATSSWIDADELGEDGYVAAEWTGWLRPMQGRH